MLSRVCVVTTSFPRFPGDPSGHFVLQEMLSLPSEIRFDVVAPSCPGSADYEDLGNIKVHRFRYFWPNSWQRLAYGDGIPDNIRRSVVAKINVPTFLSAMALAIRKHGRYADLIHAHWSPSCLAATLSGQSRPVVVTPRGSDIFNQNPLMQKANHFALPRAAAIIIYSEPYRPALSKMGVALGRVHSLPHGLPVPSDDEIDSYRAKALRQAPPDGVQLIFVGRLVRVKAVDNLIQAAAILHAEGLRFHLTLVGDGSERTALQQKVASTGLDFPVDFAGMVPLQEVKRYIAGSDIFILPSLSEGFSESLWEAMSFGLACVATRVGGAGEIIEPGKNGFLVSPGSSDELGDRLRLLIKDKVLRTEMGASARASILSSPHSLASRAEAILRVYEQAANHGH